MAKMSVEDFKTAVGDDVRRDQFAKRNDDALRVRQLRVANECKDGTPGHILAVAHLASQFDGFPSSVSMAAPNGYRGDVAITLEQGQWRLGVIKDILSAYRQQSLVFGSPTDIAVKAAKAMGIPHSSQAIDRLKQFTSWGNSAAKILTTLRAVAPLVPRHVLAASLANASQTFLVLGIPTEQDTVRAWIQGCKESGVDLDAALADESASGSRFDAPLGVLAANGEDAFIRGLLEAGADVDAPGSHESAPLLRAANRIRPRTVSLLLSSGADIHVVDSAGDGVLHNAMFNLSDDGLSSVREIIEIAVRHGVSIDVKDCHGQTAEHLLQSAECYDTWRSLEEGDNGYDDFRTIDDLLSGEVPSPRFGR